MLLVEDDGPETAGEPVVSVFAGEVVGVHVHAHDDSSERLILRIVGFVQQWRGGVGQGCGPESS